MKILRHIIFWLCFLILFVVVYAYRENIYMFYNNIILKYKSDKITLEKNEYYREYDFGFVQNTVDFKPQNAQDILNIFYTIINSGSETFTFVCPSEYVNCTDDVKNLANDQITLSHINNFVHPYNSFKHIETQYTSYGEVTITVSKTYSKDDIKMINNKVEQISNTLLINNNSTDIDKIRLIHDFIINNSKYDTERSNNNIINYRSDTAYGPLFEGYGICGGYSDAMQLFLEKLNIKNFKVASESHIWNAVNLDGVWYHLDLTWDDPVTYSGANLLEYDYFLIDTGKLISNGRSEHNFNHMVYLEMKMS